jgi:mannose-6-phosphate isomerase-like protein (cupin superfamily)
MKFIERRDGGWIEGEGYRKRILLCEDALNAPGTLVQIVEIPPHMEVADHHHESCTEVFHILAGEGSFTIDSKTFQLSVGDTLTCEPREIHNTKNPNDTPFTYIVFKTNVADDDLFWDQDDELTTGN